MGWKDQNMMPVMDFCCLKSQGETKEKEYRLKGSMGLILTFYHMSDPFLRNVTHNPNISP